MTVSDTAKSEVILCNEFFHPFTRLDNECNCVFIRPVYQGQVHLRPCARSKGRRACRDSCCPQGADSPVEKTDESVSPVAMRQSARTEEQGAGTDMTVGTVPHVAWHPG